MLNFSLRERENMPTLLLDQGIVIGTIKDPRYENLLSQAAQLRIQLDYLTFIVDNLPGVSIDTQAAHMTLEDSKIEEV